MTIQLPGEPVRPDYPMRPGDPNRTDFPVRPGDPIEPAEPARRRLHRPNGDRWIAGVCSGIGHRYGLRPNLVRAIFVLSCLLPGPQFVIYILLWAIIPGEDSQVSSPRS